MTSITVSNAAELTLALKAAHAGDTIKLTAGTYSGLAISNTNFTTGSVTITSADPTHQATLTNFGINNSSGLTFSGLNFSASGNSGDQSGSFQVNGSKNITFDSDNFGGPAGVVATAPGLGLNIASSSNVTVSNSQFHNLVRGLNLWNDNGVTVSQNSFHDIRSDGIDGQESSNVQILANTFTNFYPLAIYNLAGQWIGGDHPDAIQFWTSGTTHSTTNLTISENVVVKGAGAPIQGVFLTDQTNGAMPFINLAITNNTLVGSGGNAIQVSYAQNVSLTGNTLEQLSGSSAWFRWDNVTNMTAINPAYTTTTSGDTVVSGGNYTLTNNYTGFVTNAPQSASGLVLSTTSTVKSAVTPVTHLVLAGTGLTGIAAPTGHDTLTSISGGNTLVGSGVGYDTFVVYHSNDIISAPASAVNDTVQAWANITLPAHVQNLVGEGTSNLTLVGNSMNNTITANSGADTLTGGGGTDTFVFAPGQKLETITDFSVASHDLIDITAYLNAGLKPTITDHGTYSSIAFSGGDVINVLGVHASALTVSGHYIV